MLKSGERLWNGAIVTPQLADAYNATQSRIASFERDARPVPEELLNVAHNLIASAPVADNDAFSAIQSLDVPSMNQDSIYKRRAEIGAAIIRAMADARELQDHAETRARGYGQRVYIESVTDRLKAVTQP